MMKQLSDSHLSGVQTRRSSHYQHGSSVGASVCKHGTGDLLPVWLCRYANRGTSAKLVGHDPRSKPRKYLLPNRDRNGNSSRPRGNKTCCTRHLVGNTY